MRSRASPGRVCRRRLRLVGRTGTRRATGERQAVRAAWPRQAATAARSRSAPQIHRSRRAGASAWHDPTVPAARRRRSRAAATLPASGPGEMLAGGGFQRAMGPAGRVGRERRRSLQERRGRRKSTSRAGARRPTAPARGRRPLRAPQSHARDARLGDRGQTRDRWLPPAPDARRAARRTAPRGRSRSAGAGDETSTCTPELQQPIRLGRRQLVDRNVRAPPRRGRAAPAHPSDRPLPRAAAAVSRPAAAARAAESSLQSGAGSDPSPGRPKPARQSVAGDNSRGSSSSASGLPRVSASIRVRTRSSRGAAMTDASSSRAEASGNPPTRSSGSPASSSTRPELAFREQEDDRLGRQPPRHEREHLGRGSIKPLDVIDQADQRCLLRRVGQQAENGEPDEKSIGLRARAQAKCGRHRVSLVAPATVLDGPGVRRTADADPRTEAPSPIPPQLREGSDSPLRARPRSPGGTICLFQARPEAPTPRSVPTALRPAADRASRTRSRGLPTRPSRAELRQLPSRRQNISGPSVRKLPTGQLHLSRRTAVRRRCRMSHL